MEQPPSIPEATTEAVPAPPASSLWARLFNVFAEPGEVFAEVKASKVTAANWVVPAVLLSIVGALAAIIVLSQPAIAQQIREQQAKVMDKQVQAGKMSQADADRATEIAEKFTGPTMLKLFGSVAAVVMTFVRVVWWGFILWLVARWGLKSDIAFGKALEVAGLPMMIAVVGTIVGVLLSVILSRVIATPSPALFLKDFDLTSKTHMFLAAANVFSFWQVGVAAVGLAKVAGAPFSKTAAILFTFWLVQECLLILGGMGQFAL